MKYVIGILVIVVVAVGVYFGYNIGSNKSRSAPSNPTSTSGSSPSAPSSPDSIVLDLSNKGISKVTSDIYDKTNTTDLILSNNRIQTLPSQMGRMTNVVVFKIDHNILDGSLIGEIRQMAKLKTLDVSYNNMTGMPAEIGQLENLNSLNYSYNHISGLPNEIGNLKNNLKTFNVTGNPLSQVQISKLKALLPNTNVIF